MSDKRERLHLIGLHKHGFLFDFVMDHPHILWWQALVEDDQVTLCLTPTFMVRASGEEWHNAIITAAETGNGFASVTQMVVLMREHRVPFAERSALYRKMRLQQPTR